MNAKASPPGWEEYMATLRELQANHLMTPAATSRLVSAGKALGIAAFDAGADAMEAAAAEVMRAHRTASNPPIPTNPRPIPQVPAAGGSRMPCGRPTPCPGVCRCIQW